MTIQAFGFREIEHTADWEIQVWATDLPGLFEQAARGMYALMGARLRNEPRQDRRLHLEASDAESLLVAFLSELLFLGEQEGLGFDGYKIKIDGPSMRAELTGAPLDSIDKEIKAVTYHRLSIQQTETRIEVNVVFDV